MWKVYILTLWETANVVIPLFIHTSNVWVPCVLHSHQHRELCLCTVWYLYLSVNLLSVIFLEWMVHKGRGFSLFWSLLPQCSHDFLVQNKCSMTMLHKWMSVEWMYHLYLELKNKLRLRWVYSLSVWENLG